MDKSIVRNSYNASSNSYRTQVPPVTAPATAPKTDAAHQGSAHIVDIYLASPDASEAGRLLSKVPSYLHVLIRAVCPAEAKLLRLISDLGGRVGNDGYLLDYFVAMKMLPQDWMAAAAILRKSSAEPTSLVMALSCAVRENRIYDVEKLLDTCPQLLDRRHGGMTPLLRAVVMKRDKIVCCLLRRGAKVEDQVCNPVEGAVTLDGRVDDITCGEIFNKLVIPAARHPNHAIAGRNALTLALADRDFVLFKKILDEDLRAKREAKTPAASSTSPVSIECFNEWTNVASKIGDQMRKLLDAPGPHSEINEWDGCGDTPLTLAVDLYIQAEKHSDKEGKANALQCIKTLIGQYGANVDKANARGSTPLMLAASAGSTDLLNMLLDKKANPWIETGAQYSPLVVAGMKGHDLKPMLKLCTPQAREDVKKSLLQLLHVGSVDAVVQVLSHVGKHYFSAQEVTSLLGGLAFASNSFLPGVDAKPCIDLLLSFGAKLNANDKAMNRTPLQIACRYGSTDVVKHMIAAIPQHAKEKMLGELQNHETLLYSAINAERIDIAELLLGELKPKQVAETLVLPVGKSRVPVLHSLCRTRNVEMLNRLLNALDPESKRTLLDWKVKAAGIEFCPLAVIFTTVEPRRIEVAKTLLDHGADVNLVDNYYSTPLHYACFERDVELVAELLRRGADPTILNNCNHTPLACVQLSEGDRETDAASEQAIRNLFKDYARS